MSKRYRIARIENAARLREVAEFNLEACGAPDVPPDVLARWWTVYPNGIRVAEAPDGRIMGVISVWPVRRRVYDAIRIGRYAAAQLQPHDFESKRDRRPRWYLSGVGFAPELARSSRFMAGFITSALEDIRRESRVHDPAICAIASDSSASSTLERFAFERTNDGRYGSIYELSPPANVPRSSHDKHAIERRDPLVAHP